MAKLERTLIGDFDQILERIENGIMRGSISEQVGGITARSV